MEPNTFGARLGEPDKGTPAYRRHRDQMEAEIATELKIHSSYLRNLREEPRHDVKIDTLALWGDLTGAYHAGYMARVKFIEDRGDTTGERYHAQIWQVVGISVSMIVGIVSACYPKLYVLLWASGYFAGVFIKALYDNMERISDYDDIATEDLPPVAD